MEPPPNPHQFTLFLFSPFLWLLGKNGGKGGRGQSPGDWAQPPQKGLGSEVGKPLARAPLRGLCLLLALGRPLFTWTQEG